MGLYATHRQGDMRLTLTVTTMNSYRRERLVCVAQHTRPLPGADDNHYPALTPPSSRSQRSVAACPNLRCISTPTASDGVPPPPGRTTMRLTLTITTMDGYRGFRSSLHRPVPYGYCREHLRSLTNTRPLPWANDDYPSLTPLCELAHRHSLTTDAFRHRLHGRDGCERVVLYRHRHSR